jgi:PAS domain S-box-containing protein
MNPSLALDSQPAHQQSPVTIGLLVSHVPDSRLLAEFLRQSGHVVRTSDVRGVDWEDWADVSLIVVDELAGRRHADEIFALKQRVAPLFLPVLVVLSQKAASLVWLRRGFDDVLRLPLSKAELTARLSVFLRLRRQSQEQEALRYEAEAAQRILNTLMEYVPDGITILEAPDMKVSWMSKFGRALIGRSPEDPIDLRDWLLYHPDGISPVGFEERPAVRAARRGEVVINEEWQLQRPDGRMISLQGNAGPIRNRQGEVTGAVIVWRDITSRKLAEQEITRLLAETGAAESRFRALFEAVPAGIVIVDQQGNITDANIQTKELFGYERDELLGRSIDLLVPERVRGAHAGYRQRYHQDLQARRMGVGRDLTALRKDGREFPVEIGLSPVRTAVGVWVAALITDITERKRAERALREMNDQLERRVLERTAELQAEIAERHGAEQSLSDLSARLLQLQDEERRRIGRELHDGTAQNLAAVVMNLSIVERLGEGFTADALRALAESVGLTRQSMREIRTISYLLHPPLLDEAGLAAAISWYADGLAARSGIRVEVVVDPEVGRLSEAIELALFRVVQECLANVVRHSGSSTVRIQLQHHQTTIILEVVDSGRGMAARVMKGLRDGHDRSALGVGITGMRERMRQLGGWLEITSSRRGTTIKATVPLGGDGA